MAIESKHHKVLICIRDAHIFQAFMHSSSPVCVFHALEHRGADKRVAPPQLNVVFPQEKLANFGWLWRNAPQPSGTLEMFGIKFTKIRNRAFDSWWLVNSQTVKNAKHMGLERHSYTFLQYAQTRRNGLVSYS